MITIEIFETELLTLTKTNLPNTYVNFYVDGKFNSKFSFTYYQEIWLVKLLDAKSISLEYSKEFFWTNLA